MTSLRSRILYQTLKRVTAAISSNLTIQEQRTRLDELARRGIRLPRDVIVHKAMAGGIHSEWVEPSRRKTERVLLYLHGGGYCIGSLDTHRGLAARLALAGECRVLVADYRLAPEHPFPAALDDALAAYHWLLDQGIPSNRIAIGGDSAGGGLTIATGVSLRDASAPLPAALFLISPWTDLTFSGDSIHTRLQVDPIFGRNGGPHYVPAYAGSADPANPLISPLFADLHGLPPTLIHVGDDEILLDDSTRMEKNLEAAGVRTHIKIWSGMWHVFQVFAPWVPEAQVSIEEIGAFIRESLI
jgi:monoterpene epsilon-lactone hydrolase